MNLAQPVTEREIVLHPGMVRTATTTLQQHVLATHRELTSIGMPAVDLELNGVLRMIAHADSTRFDAARVHATLRSAVSRAPPERALVLSFENLALYEATDKGLVAARLAALFPNARVMFTIREQTSLLVSWYLTRMRPAIKRKQVVPFAEWFELQTREPWNSILDDLCFSAVIERYAQLFGDARVKVFLFEDLHANAEGYARELAHFLKVDPLPVIEALTARRTNTAMSTMHLRVWGRLSRVLPRRAMREWPRRWRLGGPAARVEIPPSVAAHLDALVSDDNRRLMQRYGLPLDRYGYRLAAPR